MLLFSFNLICTFMFALYLHEKIITCETTPCLIAHRMNNCTRENISFSLYDIPFLFRYFDPSNSGHWKLNNPRTLCNVIVCCSPLLGKSLDSDYSRYYCRNSSKSNLGRDSFLGQWQLILIFNVRNNRPLFSGRNEPLMDGKKTIAIKVFVSFATTLPPFTTTRCRCFTLTTDSCVMQLCRGSCIQSVFLSRRWRMVRFWTLHYVGKSRFLLASRNLPRALTGLLHLKKISRQDLSQIKVGSLHSLQTFCSSRGK